MVSAALINTNGATRQACHGAQVARSALASSPQDQAVLAVDTFHQLGAGFGLTLACPAAQHDSTCGVALTNLKRIKPSRSRLFRRLSSILLACSLFLIKELVLWLP